MHTGGGSRSQALSAHSKFITNNDVFPEEFETFLLTDPRIRRVFLQYHRDLLDPAWWRQRQEHIRAGRLEDVFPYSERMRFPARAA